MTSPTIRAALDVFQQAANRGTAVHLSPELVQELRDALKAESEGPANPSGYAYRYHHYSGGTYIKFNGGGEVNGSRPIEAVPYWFAPPSVPTAPPTPETPAETLAARPLLEQVAAMADCITGHTTSEIAVISSRAAAWLRDNPPGQPVAIEPRGCPTPGACSCVEPASAAPEQGDAWWHELISEIARVQHVAQGEGQGPRFDLAKAVELSRRPTPPAPEPGEVGEVAEWLLSMRELAGEHNPEERRQFTRAANLLQQQATELAALRGVAVSERLRIMTAGLRLGYMAGHNDTVEGAYADPDEFAADYAPEVLAEMNDLSPLPAPQAGEVQS